MRIITGSFWGICLALLATYGSEVGAESPKDVEPGSSPDPIAAFCQRLSPEGLDTLGVAPAELRPEGHELAAAFLKPLASRLAAPGGRDVARNRAIAELLQSHIESKILGSMI